MENSALNSNKSANIIVYQKNLKEIEEKEILTNNKFKYEEDYRYDNLLNDNSINFPKQFLDIDSKQYDSHREDTQNNNTHLNSHHKEPSNFKESSNTKNSKYIENNSFKNLNKNPNLNQNLVLNNMQNNNQKKNTSNYSIGNNNGNLTNVANSMNDLNNQENVNLVSFTNTSNYGNYNQDNYIPNYQSNNIVYSTDFALNNYELKRMGHNLASDINDNNLNNIKNNFNNMSNKINNNNYFDPTNCKKEKLNKNNPINNHVFSTIQSLGEREEEFTHNIPLNPNNKYQTIDHTSKTFKGRNVIMRSESENNFTDNYNITTKIQENFLNAINENLHFQSKKDKANNSPIETKNNIRNYTSNSNINQNYNKNNNDNQLANSFITHLDRLNDSSYIAHDLDNKINFDLNENRRDVKENIKEEKYKIKIPKTYTISNNLDLTGNDNTSINYDISQSIDPCTQRLFLKAPSMLGKTNNSISRDDTDFHKINNIKMVIFYD